MYNKTQEQHFKKIHFNLCNEKKNKETEKEITNSAKTTEENLIPSSYQIKSVSQHY